jgi:hypothetical protein
MCTLSPLCLEDLSRSRYPGPFTILPRSLLQYSMSLSCWGGGIVDCIALYIVGCIGKDVTPRSHLFSVF